MKLFLNELRAVRAGLKLDRVHPLGQSWGGMLALEYALTRPRGVERLLLSDTPASVPESVAGCDRLRKALPQKIQETLAKHEANHTTDSEERQDACMAFYRRHVCRVNPWPECVERAERKIEADPEVYEVMNGPSEFAVTGLLKNWGVRSRLREIAAPTLVLGGRYEEVTPEVTATVHRGIKGSEYVLFERSSHFPFIEEPVRFNRVVRDFLHRHDPNRSPRRR